jgi:hypothetical protein
MDTLWTLWNRFLVIVWFWFALLVVVSIGGIGWNISLFVIDVFKPEAFQHLWLDTTQLVIGGLGCALMVALLFLIIDESELW